MSKIRLATWNVLESNPRIKDGLNYLFSKSPDIVCLEEAPYSTLIWLRKNYPRYTQHYCLDMTNTSLYRSSFVCILTRLSVIGGGEYSYSKKVYRSLLSEIFYKVKGNTEHHLSVFVDVMKGEKSLRIQGARLSWAVSPTICREFIKKLFGNKKARAINIILGDLNVGTGVPYALLTGWFRGFKLGELLKSEKESFDDLIRRNGFLNIFAGEKTYPSLGQQPDYVLLSKDARNYRISVSKSSFGSDHKMLFVDWEWS